MRTILFSLSLALVSIATAQKSTPVSPLFQRVVQHADDIIYDTKAWSFYTGSPVRGTPLINDGIIYTGNASGTFFALNKKTGTVIWKYNTGQAIHSSPVISQNRIFFSNNKQTVYSLDAADGKLVWKFEMGKKIDYPWRYDYYHASPVIHKGKLLIGGDDGFFYALNPTSGKLIWKFKTKGIIRSTAAVQGSSVYFGDTEASLYALDLNTGKEQWQYRINGDTMNNENFGFDRRAITSSPVVRGNKVIFGARDGYLYCVNKDNGKNIWTVDHSVSWVISTVAIKDTMVVTGTSDGRFVQCVGLESGKEIWKCRTPLAVWSSPLIVGDKVYAGSFDGHLFCIDLVTGKRISQFKTNGKIMSSPVWNDGLLYAGSDDGHLYALKGHIDSRLHTTQLNRYVFYEPGFNVYFRGNAELVIRNYLRANGFKVIGVDSIAHYLSAGTVTPSVFVFATSFFPPSITANGKSSVIREYLDGGGRIVLAGINPVLYKIDPSTKQPFAFNPHAADTIFNLDYGPGDTRTFMGDFPCFPTEIGLQIGLPDFWTASVFINEKNVDGVLGRNENGEVSAFVKNFNNGGQLVQLWMDADRPERMDALIKAAEWKLGGQK